MTALDSITCSVDGCSAKRYVRGWCSKHYRRWQRGGDPLIVKHAWRVPVIEHLLRKTETVDDNFVSCWRWLGATQTDGYGSQRTRDGRGGSLAHRLMFVEFRGAIPVEKELDHLCRNRWCVNPWHLEPVTHIENIRRGNGVNRSGICKRGHTDIVLRKRGGRICRRCRNDASRKWEMRALESGRKRVWESGRRRWTNQANRVSAKETA